MGRGTRSHARMWIEFIVIFAVSCTHLHMKANRDTPLRKKWNSAHMYLSSGASKIFKFFFLSFPNLQVKRTLKEGSLCDPWVLATTVYPLGWMSSRRELLEVDNKCCDSIYHRGTSCAWEGGIGKEMGSQKVRSWSQSLLAVWFHETYLIFLKLSFLSVSGIVMVPTWRSSCENTQNVLRIKLAHGAAIVVLLFLKYIYRLEA